MSSLNSTREQTAKELEAVMHAINPGFPVDIQRLILDYLPPPFLATYGLDGFDTNLELLSGSKFVLDNGRKVLRLNRSAVSFPSEAIHRTDFSFAICVKFDDIHSVNRNVTLAADWSYPWSWRLFLSANEIGISLRRNINSGGSDPLQGLVDVVAPESSLKNNQWHHIGFSWSRNDRTLSLFIDGELAKTAQPYKHAGQEADIQVTSHPKWHLGLKQDDGDGGSLFSGYMADLVVDNTALSPETFAALSRK